MDGLVEAVHDISSESQNGRDHVLNGRDHALKVSFARGSHNELANVINSLDFGVAVTDEVGQITYVSDIGLRILSRKIHELIGKRWDSMFGVSRSQTHQVQAIIGIRPELRRKVLVEIRTSQNQSRWIKVEVQDDPKVPAKKIFRLYDVTAIKAREKHLEKEAFQGLVGKSNAMKLVFQQIQDIAEVNSRVLIEGETGTGKELVAQAIHGLSGCKDGPFIAVNCAGLTDSLIESQLFGHKKGSFTGALRDQKGLFESADKGTIFLDEIGDLSLYGQTRLLRVLQEREVVRVGETRPRKFEARILAATNKNLDEMAKQENFRIDLLYRLKVGRIHLPPLRERSEDIPFLADFFLQRSASAASKEISRISPAGILKLVEYSWPGNIRELQNVVEYAIIKCDGPVIETNHFPSEIVSLSGGRSPAKGKSDGQERFNKNGENARDRLLAALERANGNRSKAARHLGIGRTTLYRLLQKHNIQNYSKVP